MASRAPATLSLLLLALAAAPAAGEDPRYLPPAKQEAWAAQLDETRQRIERYERKVASSEAALSEARHEQYPRGEDLAEIEREYRESERELAEARANLDRMVEEARRAGVLPEVLRPYQE